jgi:signal transduction histidine kinase/ActR/RegA family two-component response regulator
MDATRAQTLKRYELAIELLILTFIAVNLLFIVTNLLSGVVSNDIATHSSSAIIKFCIGCGLLLIKRRQILSINVLAVVVLNLLGLYFLAAAFFLFPKYYFFAYEAYRLTYLALERQLSSSNIRMGLGAHIFYVALWYLMCFSTGMFGGADDHIIIGVLVVYGIVNESWHIYAVYHDTKNQAAYITRIVQLQRQFQDIFESIPEAIFVVKEDLTCIIRNRAADLVVLETSDSFLEVVSIDLEGTTQVRLIDVVPSLIAGIYAPDFKLGRSKIGELTYEWKASLVTWDGTDAVTLLMRDVTALIHLEQVKHESQMKNVMLRSVSHELRTPTNAFMNLLERALKLQGIPARARELIGLAADNCQHLLHVINDLLDYSQFMHGSFRLARRRFDIRQTLIGSFKPFDYMIRSAGLASEIEVDPSLPVTGWSDPSRISQVIMNLLSNAAKFTVRGRIKVTAVNSGPNLMSVIVTDSGVGISHEQQANLGSLFGRLRENESMNYEGCGLGLHISNLLAIQLGGASLGVQSAPGEGSSFSFLVKLNRDETGESDYLGDIEEDKANFILPLFDFTGKYSLGKVLVVDDNVFNRDIVTSILQEMGVECSQVCSGTEAIRVICETPRAFQLMFLDYEMPELNGPQTARRLRQMLDDGEVPKLPVIVAYTAYSSDRDVQECLEAGMREFLNKPCRADEIGNLVLKYCTRCTN